MENRNQCKQLRRRKLSGKAYACQQISLIHYLYTPETYFIALLYFKQYFLYKSLIAIRTFPNVANLRKKIEQIWVDVYLFLNIISFQL